MSHATFAPTTQPYTTQTTVGQLVADRPVDGVTVLAAGGTQIIRTDRIDGARP